MVSQSPSPIFVILLCPASYINRTKQDKGPLGIKNTDNASEPGLDLQRVGCVWHLGRYSFGYLHCKWDLFNLYYMRTWSIRWITWESLVTLCYCMFFIKFFQYLDPQLLVFCSLYALFWASNMLFVLALWMFNSNEHN